MFKRAMHSCRLSQLQSTAPSRRAHAAPTPVIPPPAAPSCISIMHQGERPERGAATHPPAGVRRPWHRTIRPRRLTGWSAGHAAQSSSCHALGPRSVGRLRRPLRRSLRRPLRRPLRRSLRRSLRRPPRKTRHCWPCMTSSQAVPSNAQRFRCPHSPGELSRLRSHLHRAASRQPSVLTSLHRTG